MAILTLLAPISTVDGRCCASFRLCRQSRAVPEFGFEAEVGAKRSFLVFKTVLTVFSCAFGVKYARMSGSTHSYYFSLTGWAPDSRRCFGGGIKRGTGRQGGDGGPEAGAQQRQVRGHQADPQSKCYSVQPSVNNVRSPADCQASGNFPPMVFGISVT
jgi:hypothetical protein